MKLLILMLLTYLLGLGILYVIAVLVKLALTAYRTG